MAEDILDVAIDFIVDTTGHVLAEYWHRPKR